MSLKKVNLYHSFTKSKLEYFARDTVSNGNYTTQFLPQNIDLYYQPVDEPTTVSYSLF